MDTAKQILDALNEKFPNKNLLNSKDIVEYTGLSRPTVKRIFGLSRGKYVDKITLANKLANLANT